MDRESVGIDFHRLRSVIVGLSPDGEKLVVDHMVNDRVEIATGLAEAGDAAAVVIEATYGWYSVENLIEPFVAVAADRLMRIFSANTCLGSRVCPTTVISLRRVP